MPNEKQEEQEKKIDDTLPTTEEEVIKIPPCRDCKKLGKLKTPANDYEGIPIE